MNLIKCDGGCALTVQMDVFFLYQGLRWCFFNAPVSLSLSLPLIRMLCSSAWPCRRTPCCSWSRSCWGATWPKISWTERMWDFPLNAKNPLPGRCGSKSCIAPVYPFTGRAEKPAERTEQVDLRVWGNTSTCRGFGASVEYLKACSGSCCRISFCHDSSSTGGRRESCSSRSWRKLNRKHLMSVLDGWASTDMTWSFSNIPSRMEISTYLIIYIYFTVIQERKWRVQQLSSFIVSSSFSAHCTCKFCF